jgi:SAM-dependent methyltransferase
MAALIAAALALGAGCGRSSPAPSPGSGLGASGSAAASGAGAPDGRPRYEGREIADLCTGAAWLDRPDRDAREQPERVLDALSLSPGMTAADVGAGTGYFTVRLARRVGPRGLVYATELSPEMLRAVDARVAREELPNVLLKLATEADAKLPPRCCDLVLLVDVYHELTDPPAVMSGIRRALKETGRLVLVEYRGEDAALAIKPAHKMTLAKIRAELEPLGFAFVESLEILPDQRIVIFTRDDAPLPPPLSSAPAPRR